MACYRESNSRPPDSPRVFVTQHGATSRLVGAVSPVKVELGYVAYLERRVQPIGQGQLPRLTTNHGRHAITVYCPSAAVTAVTTASYQPWWSYCVTALMQNDAGGFIQCCRAVTQRSSTLMRNIVNCQRCEKGLQRHLSNRGMTLPIKYNR
ncbi:hypothetical protein J6590_032629 [Homalodisca vitripennis]|nr:hypothetical protein J6590_032629 [Homalodisca vitripennis]